MKLKWFKNTSFSIPTKYHILFWLSYFTLNVIRWGSYFHDYWYSLKSNLVEFPLHIILVYFNIYFLIPKFILTKKYKTYIFVFILALFYAEVLLTYGFTTLWLSDRSVSAGVLGSKNVASGPVLREFLLKGALAGYLLLLI